MGALGRGKVEVIEEISLDKKDDNALVQNILNGDQASFNALMERYVNKVKNLAFKITRNEDDTDEVVQDVFVTIYRKADRFAGRSAFSSWLYRVAANSSFMLLRKKRRQGSGCTDEFNPNIIERSELAESFAREIERYSVRYELREELERAIAELPEEYRTVFLLRDVDGLSNDQTAKVLDVTLPAVKSRLHRARLLLREKLEKFYAEYKDDGKRSRKIAA
ncbi:MAG TPA: RNA polymerase sigma factor [Oligoflexia bacterium]|nr:RNA polymerase sigma factor [Oligoflexia bacterium]HMP27861.1 RNA polymerase sigma factor [Oligoflexia bacterium]